MPGTSKDLPYPRHHADTLQQPVTQFDTITKHPPNSRTATTRRHQIVQSTGTPCHQLVPVLEQLAAERAGRLAVLKVNADENPALSARYRVMALPTLLLFHRGEVIWSVVGARPKTWLLPRIDDALLTAV